MKKNIITLLIITAFNIDVSAQNYSLPKSFDECMSAAKNWCNCYFNECYSGRKFKDIFSIKEYYQMNDEYGDHTFKVKYIRTII
jgi:hypothetical protein